MISMNVIKELTIVTPMRAVRIPSVLLNAHAIQDMLVMVSTAVISMSVIWIPITVTKMHHVTIQMEILLVHVMRVMKAVVFPVQK